MGFWGPLRFAVWVQNPARLEIVGSRIRKLNTVDSLGNLLIIVCLKMEGKETFGVKKQQLSGYWRQSDVVRASS